MKLVLIVAKDFILNPNGIFAHPKPTFLDSCGIRNVDSLSFLRIFFAIGGFSQIHFLFLLTILFDFLGDKDDLLYLDLVCSSLELDLPRFLFRLVYKNLTVSLLPALHVLVCLLSVFTTLAFSFSNLPWAVDVFFFQTYLFC